MKMTEFTRYGLAVRREKRDLTKAGWEEVDERGGRLWELSRGARYNCRITDTRVSVTGKSIWVKVAPQP